MAESSSRTLVCSVLFLDLAGYSRNLVQEQLRLKQALDRVVTGALERVRQWVRVILDTGDDAAVAYIGDSEDALLDALAMRDGAGALPAPRHPAGEAARVFDAGPIALFRAMTA